MADLTKLLEQGERHVREQLLARGEKELDPFYHLVAPPGGEDALVPCQWSNSLQKDIMLAVVKGISRKIGAVAALFVCEAWAVHQKMDKDTPLPASIEDLPDGPPPSEHPDRVEVVQIFAMDGTDVRARMLEMKRDRKGRIVELVEDPSSGLRAMFMGRMIDGIIPPQRVH